MCVARGGHLVTVTSADEDGDALYVYDGDAMYVYARNITSAAEKTQGDLAAFCAAKAEDQVVRDFTKLFGPPRIRME